LTEAIAAGVPTIVPAATWLSNQQPNGSGLPFDGLQDFLNQTKKMRIKKTISHLHFQIHKKKE
jgi:hypothetical protein